MHQIRENLVPHTGTCTSIPTTSISAKLELFSKESIAVSLCVSVNPCCKGTKSVREETIPGEARRMPILSFCCEQAITLIAHLSFSGELRFRVR